MAEQVQTTSSVSDEDQARQLVNDADGLSKLDPVSRQFKLLQVLFVLFSGGRRSKTVWFGVGLLVFTALQLYLPTIQEDLRGWYPLVTGVVGAMVIYFRYITATALTDKIPTVISEQPENKS